MELAGDKNIIDIKHVNACFSNELSYGTILYGTLFTHLGNRFFTIENIFSYKDELIERANWSFKMEKIKKMLKYDLKQCAYNNSFIVFGLPIICRTNDELQNKLQNIKYKINSIQYRLNNKTDNYLFITYDNYINHKDIPVVNKYVQPQLQENPVEKIIVKQQVKRKASGKPFGEVVFLIKADIQNDIYNLYCLDQNFKEEQHSIAHVPDYNTSVMMNKLFRIIKENNNLDALEESDDEEEFENEDISKFVHLDKSYKMICQYNHKFKKWTPIKLANEDNKIITNYDLKQIYKTYEQNRKK
jgi:hypothetical protein